KSKGVQFTTVASLLHVNKDVVMPPVHDSLVQIDGGIAACWYWISHFLTAVFWVAVILGFFRILMLGGMTWIQNIRTGLKKRIIPASTGQYPAVSIIVPAYNEEVTAVKTIENLLQQDYPFFDIIFVDDGSKDDTYNKVLEAFKGNEKIKIFTKAN